MATTVIASASDAIYGATSREMDCFATLAMTNNNKQGRET
jgi:hypothetical protein